jgi:hypothetical protein
MTRLSSPGHPCLTEKSAMRATRSRLIEVLSSHWSKFSVENKKKYIIYYYSFFIFVELRSIVPLCSQCPRTPTFENFYLVA